MPFTARLSGAVALIAAASMAVPAAAVELPAPTNPTAIPAAAAWDSDSQNAENHRYRRYRRDRGVDAGDVIAGAVILGTVAAIASAASRSSRDRDYRYRDRDYRYRADPYRDRPYQYRPYRGDSRYSDSRGINRAVEMCVREIERDVRVEVVDSVDRTLEGWRVEGSLYDGQGFTCRIGNDGRIESVDYGQRAWNGTAAGEDRQWDDDVYAEARRAQDGAQPAYPGGPLEGEVEDDYGV